MALLYSGRCLPVTTPGQDARGWRTPTTAVEHPRAQPDTALRRARHTHYLCNQHQVSQSHAETTAKLLVPQHYGLTPSQLIMYRWDKISSGSLP